MYNKGMPNRRRGNKSRRISKRSFRRVDLPEKVADIVRHAIFNQTLKPNDRIRESQLSRELRVSRTPLREALRYLQQEGLVLRKPFRGTYVASMGERELRGVFRIRAVLESLSIQDARAHLRPADWMSLQRNLKSMKSAAQKGDLSDFNQSDMAFHRYIWKLSGDQVLEKVLNQLCRQNFIVYNVQTMALLSPKERMELVDTHRDFLQLLKTEGNPLSKVQAIQNYWLSKMREKLFGRNGPGGD